MYTPQGRRGSSPKRRAQPLRGLARDKGNGSPTAAMATMTTTTTMTAMATGEEALALMDPMMGSPELNGAGEGMQSETEIWKRFQDEGALDMPSLERKDRAALHARIAALEAEVSILLTLCHH